MKILIYGLNYEPEPVGIGKYSGELGAWLASRGHQVRVIAAPPYFPQWEAISNRYRLDTRNGVEIWRCPLWVPRNPNGLTRLAHLASFALSSLPALLTQWSWKPEVIFCVAPALFCAPGALLLKLMCGPRTLAWLHIQDFELDAAFGLGLLKGERVRKWATGWERRTLQRFGRVSTISDAMRHHVIAKGISESRASLLANWVDLETIQPQSAKRRNDNPYRQELKIEPEQLVLMYSGSMNKKQGLDLIVEVIEKLQKYKNLIWVLAGEGPGKAALAKATQHLQQVKLLPLQPFERLNDWLNLADIHLLPQKGAAADLVLPSKLLGILASGRPVVATSPAGSTLGALAEQAGRRVEPDDSEGFRRALDELIYDRNLREQLGRQARQLAEANFGKEHILSSFEKQLLLHKLKQK
jgi:colanic acid biosynthesis glycosyl transferase WcaI